MRETSMIQREEGGRKGRGLPCLSWIVTGLSMAFGLPRPLLPCQHCGERDKFCLRRVGLTTEVLLGVPLWESGTLLECHSCPCQVKLQGKVWKQLLLLDEHMGCNCSHKLKKIPPGILPILLPCWHFAPIKSLNKMALWKRSQGLKMKQLSLQSHSHSFCLHPVAVLWKRSVWYLACKLCNIKFSALPWQKKM